ncbi:MAG: class I SAM-dependent methyltransferase [Rhodobacteraceae bacterium]|nr:class I SAM-dependent methyltransferase [Paracoccaceae bacterium]
MHFNRRSLFGATAAAAGTAFAGREAEAKLPKGTDVEPRGTNGILERLPTLDLESNEEFLMSFRMWVNGPLNRAAMRRANEIIKAKGRDPKAEMDMAEAVELLKDDPTIAVRNHTWSRCQQLTFNNLRREFHGSYDAYMTEMEAADNAGPGTLELNPDMKMPDYARHEYHTQPGGYVGDPFAGHMYHYLTNNFNEGRNDQDELHRRMANALVLPADGKLKRVLDLGCGIGRQTIALKQRFPDAEVWGIDFGGPLVRYAHVRAVDMGVDVNFAQRLGEDSKFPDNHFDVITSYIIHHEVPAEISRKILKEVARILRPGGHYYPIDFYTTGSQPPRDPYGKLRSWVSHRWVHEPWMLQYGVLDFEGAARDAGLEVGKAGTSGFGGRPNTILTKPA